MDCQEIRDLLDAYALGASDAAEAKSIEVHVAECVRCWDELTSAQQTAALLALAVPVETAPARVEQRLIATAQRERSPIQTRTEPRRGFWQRYRIPWPAAAGTFGAVSAAALTVSAVFAMQVQDVRDENQELESQLQATALDLQEQAQITSTQRDTQRVMFTVLSDDTREAVDVMPESRNVTAEAYYTWSPENHTGLLICENMPDLPAGKVYQLWFTDKGKAYALRPFITAEGTCQVTMDLSFLQDKPSGIGVSIENTPGGAERPTGGWLLYAHIDD